MKIFFFSVPVTIGLDIHIAGFNNGAVHKDNLQSYQVMFD